LEVHAERELTKMPSYVEAARECIKELSESKIKGSNKPKSNRRNDNWNTCIKEKIEKKITVDGIEKYKFLEDNLNGQRQIRGELLIEHLGANEKELEVFKELANIQESGMANNKIFSEMYKSFIVL
jgi:hypothetical protein